ncbi:MAG TPA: alpha/beta hydrolase [Bacteroidota bacterium]|jgi:pimeloyl-ACP methyl ester carboxylesterase
MAILSTVLTTKETNEIDRANKSGLQPVVFVHGLWLLSSSWDRWRALFEEKGFITLAPGWPDDPDTVKEAKQDPEVFAHKRIKQVTDHYVRAIRRLRMKPVVIGHSFGGLIAQRLAGEGVAAVTVAIDPAPFRGVLPLPLSALKSGSAVLGNPLNYTRAVPLTYEQFRYSFANAVEENEAHQLYETYSVPGSGVTVFQAATANLNPWTEAQVDTGNPQRGPLLIVSGEYDHTVPWAIAHASYKQQEKNPGVTEIHEIPGRGHSLTIDHGWREVAETTLAFVAKQIRNNQHLHQENEAKRTL